MKRWNWKKGVLLLLLLGVFINESATIQAVETIKEENVQSVEEVEKENVQEVEKTEQEDIEVEDQEIEKIEQEDMETEDKEDKIEEITDKTDKTAPILSASYDVMEQVATVTVTCKDKETGIKSLKYLKGNFNKKAVEWEKKSVKVIENNTFVVKEDGTYTILAEDMAGNKTVFPIKVQKEFRAVWISYLEFSNKGYTEKEFKAHINKIFDNCVKKNMNTVIVQVRPFSDAFYSSKYFPWSVYVSGKQGKNPGYDPLKYMVEAAHKRGLEFHAWINPYRITSSMSRVSNLPKSHPARKWRNQKETKRNVLTFNGSLYYNPSSKQVQNLIINGVKEIVENYEVDGIHFDDYFYPTLGASYRKNFDAKEYEAYKKTCKKKGTTPKTIIEWRRSNVNDLVKGVYKAIKKIDKECVFGISPAGNISNLYAVDRYYADVKLWLKSSEYIDYICPQLYWSFENKVAPYDKMLEEWIAIKKSDTVNLYTGLAVYRAGISKKEAKNLYGTDIEWGTSRTVIKRQVEAGRNSKIVDGFVLYRYDNVVSKKAKEEMNNLLKILK